VCGTAGGSPYLIWSRPARPLIDTWTNALQYIARARLRVGDKAFRCERAYSKMNDCPPNRYAPLRGVLSLGPAAKPQDLGCLRKDFSEQVEKVYRKSVFWSRSWCNTSCGGAVFSILTQSIEREQIRKSDALHCELIAPRWLEHWA
jgi:hypothetical protein